MAEQEPILLAHWDFTKTSGEEEGMVEIPGSAIPTSTQFLKSIELVGRLRKSNLDLYHQIGVIDCSLHQEKQWIGNNGQPLVDALLDPSPQLRQPREVKFKSYPDALVAMMKLNGGGVKNRIVTGMPLPQRVVFTSWAVREYPLASKYPTILMPEGFPSSALFKILTHLIERAKHGLTPSQKAVTVHFDDNGLAFAMARMLGIPAVLVVSREQANLEQAQRDLPEPLRSILALSDTKPAPEFYLAESYDGNFERLIPDVLDLVHTLSKDSSSNVSPVVARH